MNTAISTTTLNKARLITETGFELELQYNPKDFKYSHQANWQEVKSQGRTAALEFQSTAPATIAMELIFDETGTHGDVREIWVRPLLAMAGATEPAKDGEAQHLKKERPPVLKFQWGNFTMVGVIEKLDVNYLMFAPDGTPVRAKVSARMKEWVPAKKAESQGLPSFSRTPWVDVGPGDTITTVAARNKVDWRSLAELNGIDDPLGDVHAGMGVLLPV